MSNPKEPKPFLKKGTRKYLSNATVRSLNQVPKVVDFGNGQNDEQSYTPITNPNKKVSEEIKVEIKVNSKPPSFKKQSEAKTVSMKSKQNKNINEQSHNSSSSVHQKKNTVLDDYIGFKSTKKQAPIRQNKSKQKPIPQPAIQNKAKISMAGFLKRQDQQIPSQDEEDQDIIHQQKVIPRANFKTPVVSVAKKSSAPIEVEQTGEKINFNSDSQQQKPNIKNKNPIKNSIFPKPIEKKSRWEQDNVEEQRSIQNQNKGPSKILQKYYKKQPEVVSNEKSKQVEKRYTKSQIPKQVKQEIFKQLLEQKHSDFTKKLDELQASILKSKKQRENVEQLGKQLAKDRQQFEKEMEKRRKQFQQKVTAQNNKIARQKKYLKNQQTTGKPDWRIKNQVEELRNKLEQVEAQKKKIKADLSRQVDRLKKKMDEQQQEIETLKGQIRCLQMQKIVSKQKSKQPEKKNQVSKIIHGIVRYWQDAPTYSYVSNFMDDNFTLISLEPQFYSYEALEYWKYYMQRKDDPEELVSEEKDQSGSKIFRMYKNGKQETELIRKSLRQVFPPPFRFNIVHHANGDLKMVLPEGVHVYYSKKSQITEWKINPQKTILNFHQLGQIEMKFKNRRGEISQQYKGNLLNRSQNGEIKRFRRNEQGQIVCIN